MDLGDRECEWLRNFLSSLCSLGVCLCHSLTENWLSPKCRKHDSQGFRTSLTSQHLCHHIWADSNCPRILLKAVSERNRSRHSHLDHSMVRGRSGWQEWPDFWLSHLCPKVRPDICDNWQPSLWVRVGRGRSWLQEQGGLTHCQQCIIYHQR